MARQGQWARQQWPGKDDRQDNGSEARMMGKTTTARQDHNGHRQDHDGHVEMMMAKMTMGPSSGG